jgi:hypothetical protein
LIASPRKECTKVVCAATDNAAANACCKVATSDRDIAVATWFIRDSKFDKRAPIPPCGKKEDTLMYTVVRSYFGKGAKELFDVLEKNKADVEKTMRSVKGFVSYALVRSEDGAFSVTVCNDKAGTDESVEKARDWIAKNAAGIGVASPKLSEGSNVFDLK